MTCHSHLYLEAVSGLTNTAVERVPAKYSTNRKQREQLQTNQVTEQVRIATIGNKTGTHFIKGSKLNGHILSQAKSSQ